MWRKIAGRKILMLAAFAAAFFVELRAQDSKQNSEQVSRVTNFNELDYSQLCRLGLLSEFQIHSVLDYRAQWGDILSASELSLVDGFTQEDVEQIASICEFEPARPMKGAKHVITARVKKPYEKKGFSLTAKYGVSASDWQLNAVVDNDPQEKFPDFVSASALWRDFIVGDYKASYGQGLVMWKGMSMSSLGEPASLLKRSQGMLPYKSSDENNYLRGLAWSHNFDRIGKGSIGADAFVSYKDRTVGSCVSYSFSTWKIEALAFAAHTTSGIQTNAGVNVYGSIRYIRLFGEIATNINLAPALRLGAIWRPLYELEIAGAAWAYAPAYSSIHAQGIKDQTGFEIAARYGLKRWTFNANLRYAHKVSSGENSLKYRLMTKYSFPFGLDIAAQLRTGLHFRTDISYPLLQWRFAARIEAGPSAFASYIEASWRRPRFEATARLTYYNTDSWASRIYIYERDVPQSFATTAYYKKGVGAYLVLRYTPVKYVDMWLKVQQSYCTFFTRITIPG